MNNQAQKRKIDNNNDDEDVISTKKNDSESAALSLKLEEYSCELDNVVVTNESEVLNFKNMESELVQFENLKDYRRFQPIGFNFIEIPVYKYSEYNAMTTEMGYPFNEKNKFLRNGGIYKLIEMPRCFFNFWSDSLDIFFPNNPVNKREYDLVFRKKECTTHEFRCDEFDEKKSCNFKIEAENGENMRYFISGTFKSRLQSFENKSFQIYYIEINNAKNIKTPMYNISDCLNLKSIQCKVFHIKCKHNACGVGKENKPFDEMDSQYTMCGAMDKYNELQTAHDKKKCYIIGKGITGRLHAKSNTLYLNTYNIERLYIID